MAGKIVIRGARVHNLKNIDLEIPRDRLIVITGVSGSGKSSLAFDTLYAEGRRRYLESLAVDARQFLRQLEKPDVDSIDGLSPAIAIQQKAGGYTPRSTVGTVTEIYDYLRLLFARIGEPSCLRCGRQVQAHTVEQIVDRLLGLPVQTRVLVMAPVVSGVRVDHRERLSELAREGFARVRIDGAVRELSEEIHLETARPHQIDLIVDRLVLRQGVEKRLADSLEIASRVGGQVIKVGIQSGNGQEPAKDLIFSQKFACAHCRITLPEITPALFSFNSLQGACPACAGLGADIKKRGRSESREKTADGRPCRECGGTRLKEASLTVKLGGKNIAEVAAMPVDETLAYCHSLALDERRKRIGQRALSGIIDRIGFLLQVGLGYLSLDRPSLSLSGGEAQRVRLATQIGSSLTGVLYILDEPSIGLHQSDNARLLSLLRRLRDRGNSVIVVEHDPETILAADRVIDMGPGAGDLGGTVVAQGTPQELARDQQSLTGQYLSARSMDVVSRRRKGSGVLVIKGARQHNLKNLTVEIPVGVLACVTGVSGAGKSSLVMDILYNALAARLHRARVKVGEFDRLIGAELFDRVVGIDQASIGRTPRSTPATYTGLLDPIRKLFAQLPEARVRGFGPARFSFNARAGRCDACAGEGIVRVDMSFLPEVLVTCDICKGTRYGRETLAVKYKGYSVADVLAMTVRQALPLLNAIPAADEKLRALREVGLDYLRLDQAGATLSGGEAQRVKLARELARRATGHCLYILDEPTTGLHFDDVRKLLELLHRLIDEGNSMVVIEHNLDVIRAADHVIDLGPRGGREGGEVVAQGTPDEIAHIERSLTGQYLRNSPKMAGSAY